MRTPLLQLSEVNEADFPDASDVNDTFWALDVLVQPAVLSRTTLAPPGDAVQGDRYIVPTSGATGVFANRGRQVAYLTPDGWQFRTPQNGWAFRVLSESSVIYIFIDTDWVLDAASTPDIPAESVTFDPPTGSSLTATNVRDALDELEQLAEHVPAQSVTYSPASGSDLAATNARDALDELDARDAGGVGFEPLTGSSLIATNVRDALDELDQTSPGSLLSAKGDLIVMTASGPVRLPVGTNGKVLTAKSSAAEGVSYETPSGGGGGSTVQLPGTIDDLLYWLDASQIKSAVGATQTILQNATPWFPALTPLPVGTPTTVISAARLNGLNTISFPGAAAGRFKFAANTGFFLPACSIFVVFKPGGSFSGYQDFLCGSSSNSLEFSIASGGMLGLVQSFSAVIGNSTTNLTLGTWYQGNVTYDSVGGGYAFRVASTAAGSGTNAKAITSASDGVAYDPQVAGQDYAGDLAEMIVYNRVLSGPEIASIEAYLLAKWGV